MLNVYLTVDTEIWPENWDLSHKRFPTYFDRYIRGATPKGEFGLPFQLRILKEHGLKAVFFVEPLFAHHYGLSPLRDIVAMIQESGQSVELHLHTEWIGRTQKEIPPGRFQLNLRDYAREEQRQILEVGKNNLLQSGADGISAFRAGNFGANADTLDALADNDILIDSSYDRACALGPFLDLEQTLFRPTRIGKVMEFPVTVFEDGWGRARHLQIGANSHQEMSVVLDRAADAGWHDAVLFWHSGELLNRKKTRYDPIAGRRFAKLCEFVARKAGTFTTCHFQMEEPVAPAYEFEPTLRVPKVATASRYGEQILRRLWGS